MVLLTKEEMIRKDEHGIEDGDYDEEDDDEEQSKIDDFDDEETE